MAIPPTSIEYTKRPSHQLSKGEEYSMPAGRISVEMRETRSDLNEKARGVLLGTALGDAFAYPFEGTPLGGLDRLEASLARRAASSSHWGYSDDTEMMLGVAESIIEEVGIEPRHVLERFALNYEPARGYGKGMKLAIDALMRGKHWRVVAFSAWPEGSKGNGAAARIGPVSCLHHSSTKELSRAITAATVITHAHPDAIAGALLQGHAVSAAIRCKDLDSLDRELFLAELRSVSYPSGTWAHSAIDEIGRMLCLEPSRLEVVEALGHGYLAQYAVPAAIYCFLRNAPDFRKVVVEAASLGGDTDTIAAMAGALAGALVGSHGIPSLWKDNLEHGSRGYEYMLHVADGIARLASDSK